MPDACGNSADCINEQCHCGAAVRRIEWTMIVLHCSPGDMQGNPTIWESAQHLGKVGTKQLILAGTQQCEQASTQQSYQASRRSSYLRPKQADGALLGSRSRKAVMRCIRWVVSSA